MIIASLFPFAQAFVAPALHAVRRCLNFGNDTHPLKPFDVLLFETGVKEVKVQGLVRRLLARKEWIGQASSIECVRGEKDGLVNAGTWIESQSLGFSQRLMLSPGLGEHPIPFISVHSW